jgi:hypothetical protein
MPESSIDPFFSAARLTTRFYEWEQRGRGWTVWPYPVVLEPPFEPFEPDVGHAFVRDDARKPSLIVRWLSGILHRRDGRTEIDEHEEPVPPPARSTPFEIVEIHLALAPDVKVAADVAEQFLLSLATCSRPMSFEVLGTSESVTFQIACADADALHVQAQLQAHFPDAVCSTWTHTLAAAWRGDAEHRQIVVEFGVSQEFMRPLRTLARFGTDPLISLTGALSDLREGDVGLLQVLFEPATSAWPSNILRSVSTWDGSDFFVDAPELLALAKEKVDRPLFAAVIRLAAQSNTRPEALSLVQRMGGALNTLSHPASNDLFPLDNSDYPDSLHARDVLRRQSRRSGVLLNSQELVSLVHPPSPSIRTPRLARGHRRTKAMPKTALGHQLVLGTSTHGGVTRTVSLSTEQRLRHLHLVGASGTGKSTLLLNMLVQDMEQGNGFALIDPHGDLVEHVLARVPANRITDVILVDPADTEWPVGFNILSAHSDLERTLLASDLVSVFRRLSTSWGDQMTSVLSNAVLAFLESERGGTLADLRRFLIEAEYRNEFLESVRDPEVVYYWKKEFPLLAGRPQAPLLTRLDTFLRPKLVRGMVAQQANTLDFASIMNEGKILLVKLAQGAIGEENAALLGTLFVAKIHQLALSRQSLAETDRRPFYLVMDEFQHFVTPSMATLLTGARKYRVGLVLAHQELRQLWNQDRDVAGAVLANAATRFCFRVGDDDAKKLEDGFSSFTSRDLQNLSVGQAVCRVDRADADFSLDTMEMVAIDEICAVTARERVVQASRERHGHPTANLTLADRLPAPSPKGHESVENLRTDPALVPKPAVPGHVAVLKSPGRGGPQHKYLQGLIRRWAEAKGWRATIEKSILDGLGSVDVALEKGGTTVACEIGISTSYEHEIANIHKCLSAGFSIVVAVVTNKKRMKVMGDLLRVQLPDTGKCLILLPEQLLGLLDSIPAPALKGETNIRGYLVRTNEKSTMGKAAAAYRTTIAKTIVSAMKRLSSS